MFAVIMAFSGVASAYYITDSGSSTTYYSNGNKDIFSWYLVYYNANNIVFKFQDKYIYKKYSHWYVHKVNIVMPIWKTSYYGKIYAKEYIYVNGYYKKSSATTAVTGYTSKTAYKQFKERKPYVINGCKSDAMKN